MSQQTLHIHLVSDSTGETVHQVARACLAQFTDVKPVEHVWTLVRSKAHLDALFAGLDRYPGILLMSIIDQDLRSTIESACSAKGVPAASVLDPVVDILTNRLTLEMNYSEALLTAYVDVNEQFLKEPCDTKKELEERILMVAMMGQSLDVHGPVIG